MLLEKLQINFMWPYRCFCTLDMLPVILAVTLSHLVGLLNVYMTCKDRVRVKWFDALDISTGVIYMYLSTPGRNKARQGAKLFIDSETTNHYLKLLALAVYYLHPCSFIHLQWTHIKQEAPGCVNCRYFTVIYYHDFIDKFSLFWF